MSGEDRVRVLREAAPDSWLAFSKDEDRLVASGKSFSEAVRMAQEAGESDPLITKIPPDWGPKVL